MMKLVAPFISGLIFALGLGLSGMTDANKVIGFLNLAGTWDPSLAFVMVGAIGVHLVAYRVILKRKSPLFAETFHIPRRKDIDTSLLGGAALFGIGWGMGGFCPGPGLVSFTGFGTSAVTFVAFMLVGMLIHKFTTRNRTKESPSSSEVVEAATGVTS